MDVPPDSRAPTPAEARYIRRQLADQRRAIQALAKGTLIMALALDAALLPMFWSEPVFVALLLVPMNAMLGLFVYAIQWLSRMKVGAEVRAIRGRYRIEVRRQGRGGSIHIPLIGGTPIDAPNRAREGLREGAEVRAEGVTLSPRFGRDSALLLSLDGWSAERDVERGALVLRPNLDLFLGLITLALWFAIGVSVAAADGVFATTALIRLARGAPAEHATVEAAAAADLAPGARIEITGASLLCAERKQLALSLPEGASEAVRAEALARLALLDALATTDPEDLAARGGWVPFARLADNPHFQLAKPGLSGAAIQDLTGKPLSRDRIWKTFCRQEIERFNARRGGPDRARLGGGGRLGRRVQVPDLLR